MKYQCKSCLYASSRRLRFVNHIKNNHEYDADDFFNNYDNRDTSISSFCCGIPFSSQFRMSYHVYREHSDVEQYGGGNNIRRVPNNQQPEIYEYNRINENFISSNYVIRQSINGTLTKKTYDLYTDKDIIHGTTRDT